MNTQLLDHPLTKFWGDIDRAFLDRSTNFFDMVKKHNNLPYDIRKDSQSEDFSIDIALAGYNKEDISVEVKNSTLFVKANREDSSESENYTYIHKGLSHRNVTLSFPIHDNYEVQGAKFVNGLLTVSLRKALISGEKIKVE